MRADRPRTVKFYLYRDATNNNPVYVGRTTGTLAARDCAHRSKGRAFRAGKEYAQEASIFDRGYYSQEQYRLELLEERTWTTYEGYRVGSYHIEQMYISKYNTMKTSYGRNCPTQEQVQRLGWRVPETTPPPV